MDLKNVYFVIGTFYAGKSTIAKNLAKSFMVTFQFLYKYNWNTF